MKRLLHYFTFASIITAHAFTICGERQEASFTPRMVKIQAESEVDSLQDMGVNILRRRGDILLCFFPAENTRSGVSHHMPKRHITPTLDVARSYYDAGSIQSGTATGIPYTGKGVVVGLCDNGIDPLHPTFLDASGRSRIKRVVQYVEEEGLRLQLDGDEDYRNWKTDNQDMYHATHVCGILAGGGAGTPYQGIASDAEIVATVSTLTDVGLLAGVEDIIDYAKEQGKPAVINISVGCYTGPHDGSSLFSQYLDMCADDAIIVMSSGNEGNSRNTLLADFTTRQEAAAFILGNRKWDQYHMYGATDIWSGSAQPFSVCLGLYDTNSKQISGWTEPFRLDDGEVRSFVWDGSADSYGGFPFEGELWAEGGIDPENGRYRTVLSYDFNAAETSTQGPWARYQLAVKAIGKAGEDVEVYTDGIYTRMGGVSGYTAPSTQRTVSDLACGFNVISVGMYGNRDLVPHSNPDDLDDGTVVWDQTGFQAGQTVKYSSYGTLRDGRVLPTTVAPGANLVSAASRHYIDLHPTHPHLRQNGTVWLDESGTSMSSPYVAGYIATWLEAVPTLTAQEVRSIIADCNRMDIPEPDDPHNATGYFDPVRGLRLALQAGGVESVENPGGVLLPDDAVEAYDVAGIKRYAGPASGLSGIEKGLYVVRTPYGVMKLRVKD